MVVVNTVIMFKCIAPSSDFRISLVALLRHQTYYNPRMEGIKYPLFIVSLVLHAGCTDL